MASITPLNGSAARGSEPEAEAPRAARPGTASINTHAAANIPTACVGNAEDAQRRNDKLAAEINSIARRLQRVASTIGADARSRVYSVDAELAGVGAQFWPGR